MKLLETLTNAQLESLLGGNVVGVFGSLITNEDLFFPIKYELCLGYYLTHSSNKTISPAYEKLRQMYEINPSLPDSADYKIGRIIRAKFSDKWNRIYDTLIRETYSALDSESYTETLIGKNQNTDTHNLNKVKTGNNSDTTTFDTTVNDSGSKSFKEIVTNNSNTNEKVYGFNSSTAVNDSETGDTSTETTEGASNDNKTENTSKKTGTEATKFNRNESEGTTGTVTTDITLNETKQIQGRNVSPSDLIQKELDLRNKNIFYNIVYDDIDSILTLQIYL